MSEATARAIVEGAERLYKRLYGAMWGDYFVSDPGVRGAVAVLDRVTDYRGVDMTDLQAIINRAKGE